MLRPPPTRRTHDGAINKKDEERYADELKEERQDCTSIARPRCEPGETVSCVQGTCMSSRVTDADTD